MSYDIDIDDFETNYTNNLSKMIYEHMDGGIPSLHDLTGKEGYEKIMRCLSSIKRDINNRKEGLPAWLYLSSKYDPPNFWGDCTSCILWLASLAYEFNERPESIIKVCY